MISEEPWVLGYPQNKHSALQWAFSSQNAKCSLQFVRETKAAKMDFAFSSDIFERSVIKIQESVIRILWQVLFPHSRENREKKKLRVLAGQVVGNRTVRDDPVPSFVRSWFPADRSKGGVPSPTKSMQGPSSNAPKARPSPKKKRKRGQGFMGTFRSRQSSLEECLHPP
ncbi:hypothetical protein K0M31_011496 [Melipona bicolor]|uniref:Uncharacterized protein n=1 Tax=Melipona bicolor TaxID=60889 RepID=A0AA40KUT6_9HYME|nr:hypothetical protein K0M31_011496 [Melipona bicolor]